MGRDDRTPMIEQQSKTQALQRRFAAHLRAPELNPLPEFPDARLAVYRRLFFNNVYGLLASNFPVALAVLGAARWRILCRHFYAEHACHNPRFTEFAGQFLDFAAIRPEYFQQPEFLRELLHYEYVETELTLAPDSQLLGKSAAALAQRHVQIALSPLARLLAYRFPVHRISQNYQPVEAEEQATFLLVWRDASDHIRFESLSAGAMRLLMPLAEAEVDKATLIASAADESAALALVDRLLTLGALVYLLTS